MTSFVPPHNHRHPAQQQLVKRLRTRIELKNCSVLLALRTVFYAVMSCRIYGMPISARVCRGRGCECRAYDMSKRRSLIGEALSGLALMVLAVRLGRFVCALGHTRGSSSRQRFSYSSGWLIGALRFPRDTRRCSCNNLLEVDNLCVVHRVGGVRAR